MPRGWQGCRGRGEGGLLGVGGRAGEPLRVVRTVGEGGGLCLAVGVGEGRGGPP